MISSDEYVKLAQNGETRCPSCGDRFMFWTGLENDTKSLVSQVLICQSCGATWEENYVLTGYINLVVPNAND